MNISFVYTMSPHFLKTQIRTMICNTSTNMLRGHMVDTRKMGTLALSQARDKSFSISSHYALFQGYDVTLQAGRPSAWQWFGKNKQKTRQEVTRYNQFSLNYAHTHGPMLSSANVKLPSWKKMLFSTNFVGRMTHFQQSGIPDSFSGMAF